MKTAVLEAFHLVVEAAAKAILFADEVFRWHPPVFESNLIRVHASVANGVDRSAFHLSDSGRSVDVDSILSEGKSMAVAARFRNNEQAEPLVGLAAVRVGSCEKCESVGTGAEGAPCLHAVDDVAVFTVRTGSGSCGDLDVGNVTAVVGLGDRNCWHDLCCGELGKPGVLLVFGSTLYEGTGENLWAGNERAADSEACSAEFFGCNHHGDVLVVATFAETTVFCGDAQAECPEFCESGDDLFGHITIRAVHMLGVRGDDVLSKSAERVAHHVHVVGEVKWAR